MSQLVLATESRENESQSDIALASIWIMNEISRGGYIKPSMNLTVLDSDPAMMWEVEGGWRFTHWFKTGFSLERSFSDVDRIKNPATIIGFVVGASGRTPFLGKLTIDLNFGSFEADALDNVQYFIEPGLHIKRRLYKQVYWTSGITYRYVEDETLELLGHNSFNSLSFKLGLTSSKY